MISPRARFPRLRKEPSKPCLFCGTPMRAVTIKEQQRLYCDQVCRRAHAQQLKAARRPAEVRCSYCQRPIDVMAREPRVFQKQTVFFCDPICAQAERVESGKMAEMSRAGNAVIRDYTAIHGRAADHEARSKRITKQNQAAPPKAKHLPRHGFAWGYEVIAYPNEAGDGYDLRIPELPELGTVSAKTFKGGLRDIRQRFVETRKQEGSDS